MKSKSRMFKALLGGALIFLFTFAPVNWAVAQTGTITFVSDTTWAASDSTGTFLDFAQNVCLNDLTPSNCPAGATLYGYAGLSWAADLSSIPGATWIWAPGITGATSPAFPAEFFFSKAFNLPGSPIAGTISVAADDFAEVIVNGTSVGTTGSTTDVSLAGLAQSSLTTFDITSFLVTGTNVITVRAANGLFGCGTGPYSCNPAGVVYGGSLQFQQGATPSPTPSPTPVVSPSPIPSPTEPPTAVSLVGFEAKVNGEGSVTLAWETASEVDNAGFNIYRSKRSDGTYKKVNGKLIPAQGNGAYGASYSFEDAPGIGIFYYKLEDVDSNGVSTMHGPVKVRVRSAEGEARRRR